MMEKRPLVIGLVVVSIFAGAAAGYGVLRLGSENARLRQDVAEYQRQLREQGEAAARSRRELTGELGELQQQLAESGNLFSSLSSELEEMRGQVSPDYERLLRRAREEAAREQRVGGPAAARAMAVDPETARAEAEARVPELYRDFMAELGLGEEEQGQVLSALVEFEARRSQNRADLLAGNLTPRQALDLFGAEALSASLSDLLGGDQLAELQQYSNFLSRDSARLIYGETLSRMGAALTGDAGDLALQTVLDEIYSEAGNYGALVGPDGSMRTAHNGQLAAYDRAREQLQGQLNPEQMNQLDRFLDSRRNGMDLVLEATVDEDGGLRLRNERVAAANLPD